MSGPARQVSRRSAGRNRRSGDSRTTVLVALAANALVTLAKLAGGLASGSTALLAEAAHSTADTANQAFLLTSIKLGRRPPSPEHPFGEGRQRFLWTFMAAVGMFLAGAIFAIGYGTVELLAGKQEEGGFAIAWVTVAVALLAEGASWVRAVRQARSESRDAGEPFLRHIRTTRDPNVKMVVFEDTAALIGIGLAAGGIGLHQLTGQSFWDPLASILIGVLLVTVAFWMGRDTSDLLIGASAKPEERETLERVLEDHSAVEEVVELLTVVLGPTALLVAARVNLRDDIDAAAIERASSELDEALREAVPDVTEVFLDATPGGAREDAAA